jgi:hypothetical protein
MPGARTARFRIRATLRSAIGTYMSQHPGVLPANVAAPVELPPGSRPKGLAAGYRMKVVQETLGLSSITIAGDTYASVLPQFARQSAEDVATLIRSSQIPSSRRRPGQAARPDRACRRPVPGARQAR